MVLPFQPLFLTFDEIKYSLDMAQEMKKQGVFEEHRELLKGVSGVFRPRVLTALMGVSGAGKTTLMDVTFEAIQGVPKIKEGYNPATWMLKVTSAGIEASLKVNFTNVYRKSELYRQLFILIMSLSLAVEALHAFIQDESEHNLHFPLSHCCLVSPFFFVVNPSVVKCRISESERLSSTWVGTNSFLLLDSSTRSFFCLLTSLLLSAAMPVPGIGTGFSGMLQLGSKVCPTRRFRRSWGNRT
ncbi:Jasmonic acid-amido synthetase JAR1 isoform E [Glycine soja]|nr:Jasmonic acid-amido synthetase JAR1 isoform E [Glycine soja]